MSGRRVKCSVSRDGRLSIVDPGFDCLPLIRQLQPDFVIQSVPPPPEFVPSFQRTRRISIPEAARDELSTLETTRLWELHDDTLRRGGAGSSGPAGASLLDLKIELARREIERCRLCGRLCGANRFVAEGRCGLGADAFYGTPFVHVAEEEVINLAATVRLDGCSLGCAFCQARDGFASDGLRKLDEDLWSALPACAGFAQAASLEFGGGNPDESAFAILGCLATAPHSLRLPVVMNDNGYASPVLYKLLEGIADVWLTDFKFGNAACARTLSGAGNYAEVAEAGLSQICGQNAKVIIRMLVLPGHVECCHKKTLRTLSAFREKIWLSIMDGYVPDWKANEIPGLDRLPAGEEIAEVREAAEASGLRDVAEAGEEFWKGA